MLTDTDMQCFFNHGGTTCPNFGEGSYARNKNDLVESSTLTTTAAMGDTFNRCDEGNMELDMTCCICLENFSVETKKMKQVKVALLVQCGHFYHQKCMNNWLNTKEKGQKSCPTCRTEVTYDMEVEVFPVEVLIKNRKSIMCLRQKHAHRQKLQMLLRQQQNQTETDDEESELTFGEWVHISLLPMENTDPIAIQHSHSSRERDNRPGSPFTIITADEIPSRSEDERSSHESLFLPNDFLSQLHNSILSSLPTPYLSPYDNWMTMR